MERKKKRKTGIEIKDRKRTITQTDRQTYLERQKERKMGIERVKDRKITITQTDRWKDGKKKDNNTKRQTDRLTNGKKKNNNSNRQTDGKKLERKTGIERVKDRWKERKTITKRQM